MYIPDPVELMEARMARSMDKWEDAQYDVPKGMNRCPDCKSLFDYEPISISADPSSPVMCFDCLPDDVKAAYLKFYGENKNEDT